MALEIDDPELEALAAQLAEEQGMSIEETILDALQNFTGNLLKIQNNIDT